MGTAAVLIFVIFPWIDGRAPRIGDVTIFAIVILSPVVGQWIPNMPCLLPANYSGESGRTPRCRLYRRRHRTLNRAGHDLRRVRLNQLEGLNPNLRAAQPASYPKFGDSQRSTSASGIPLRRA